MAEEASPEKTTAEESFLSQPNSDAQGQLTAAVDELLDQLQSKFDNVSKEMFSKCPYPPYRLATVLPSLYNTNLLPVDDMTRRLDELEASLTASGTDSAAATPTQ
ncbi:uncharacterized protein N7496_006887 [Penicillium cataractarum]|uniref:Uncharacterized protein n=1 Tax=Penicillium cataractarum TaxID=2100454 RepID=A0A9W9V8Z5_9EURO|nr:uncharacterized protein N7496_006887 [Penicillium cataractarum]KAJ5370795.1 hypothetical protein N7496_006887 [Penicillium cataractarum]